MHDLNKNSIFSGNAPRIQSDVKSKIEQKIRFSKKKNDEALVITTQTDPGPAAALDLLVREALAKIRLFFS